MVQYTELQQHFNRVRWAWKRTTMLQGLAAVLIEGLGLFLLFALLDHLYHLSQELRLVMLTGMGGFLAYLLARHILRPALKQIPDEQIALYIEEHAPQNDGALLSAAAFGPQAGAAQSEVRKFIVEKMVQAALEQAGRLELSKILNLAKLRKYALAAVIVLAWFGLSAQHYAKFFNRSANHLLRPWYISPEEMQEASQKGHQIGIVLEASVKNNTVVRGAAVALKAKLSEAPNTDVVIKFKTKGEAIFQDLKMEEIEELHTFALKLTDINDDCELFAKCGDCVSQTISLHAVDPLDFRSFEVTLTPPAWTQQEPRVITGISGDISALEGSKVNLRIAANNPLASGELLFTGGQKVPLAIDAASGQAAGSFEITKNTSYTAQVASTDGQQIETPTAFVVKALVKQLPTIKMLAPGSDLSVCPIAEITFTAKVGDEVGVGGLDVVYTVADSDSLPERASFKLPKPQPGEKEVSYTLPLADLNKGFKPGDTVFYYLAVKDLKGQEVLSDMYMIAIRPFEITSNYSPPLSTDIFWQEPGQDNHLQLMPFIAAAWNLHTEKRQIIKAEYETRCDALVKKMTSANGEPKRFRAKDIPTDKALQELIKKGDEEVKKGVTLLKTRDAGGSVADLSKALAWYTKAGVAYDRTREQEHINYTPNPNGFKDDAMQDTIGFLDKMAMPKKVEEVAIDPDEELLERPDYARKLNSNAAKEAKEASQELTERQKQLVDEFLAEARPDAESNKPPQAGAPQAEEDKEAKKTDEKSPKAPNKQSGAQAQQDKEDKEAKKTDEKSPKQAGAQTAGKSPQAKDDKEAKNTDEKSPKESGDQTADKSQQGSKEQDKNNRKDGLANKQQELINDTKKLTDKFGENVPEADKDAQEVLDRFRQSVAEMEETARQLKKGDMKRAASYGEEAKNDLVRASELLDITQHKNLEDAIAAAEDKANRIAQRQKKIEEATSKVTEQIEKRTGKPAGQAPLLPDEHRKMQGLAKLEDETQKETENLENYVRDLETFAENSGKKDAHEEIARTARTMKQEMLVQTMVSATVDLGKENFPDAKANEQKVQKTLDKVAEGLNKASNALAQTTEEKLKRAVSEAKEAMDAIKQLANAKDLGEPEAKETGKDKGKSNKEKDNTPNKDMANKDKTTNEKDNTPNKDMANKGKPANEKDNTPNKDMANKDKSANEKDNTPNKDMANKAKATNEKDNAPNKEIANNKKADDKEKKITLTPEEKQQALKDLSRAATRLQRHLKQDNILPDTEAQELHAFTVDEHSFEDMLKEAEKAKVKQYYTVLKAVSVTLESKLDNLLKARRLAVAQREGCPASYQDLVNAYYEALGKD